MYEPGHPEADPHSVLAANWGFRPRDPGGFRVWHLLAIPLFFALIAGSALWIFSAHREKVPPEAPPATRLTEPSMDARMIELSKQGMTALEAKDYERALSSFRQMTEVDPGSAAAWNNVGLTLLGQQQFAEALDPLGKAIALDPVRAPIPLVNRSLCLRNLNRLDEAKGDLQAAQKLNPSDPVASNFLLLTRIQAGERDVVAKELQAARAFPIPSLEPLSIGASVGLALSEGDLAQAQAYFKRARGLLNSYEMAMMLTDPLIAPSRELLTQP